jgi:hypothetical protein
MFSRKQIAEVAADIASQLRVIDDIKALQVGQKELADTLELLGDRLRKVESELRALKAETILDALKETQAVVNAVQGSFNQRIETLAVKVALMEGDRPKSMLIDGQAVQTTTKVPSPSLPNS